SAIHVEESHALSTTATKAQHRDTAATSCSPYQSFHLGSTACRGLAGERSTRPPWVTMACTRPAAGGSVMAWDDTTMALEPTPLLMRVVPSSSRSWDVTRSA